MQYPSLIPRKQQRLANNKSYHGDVARESMQQFHRELSRTTSTPQKNLHKAKSVEVKAVPYTHGPMRMPFVDSHTCVM